MYDLQNYQSGGHAAIQQLTEGTFGSLCYFLHFQSILHLFLQITSVYSHAFYQNFSFNKPLGTLSFS